MTANEYYNANVRDGRAMLRRGSRTGRSGRPGGMTGLPTCWLVKINQRLILVLDDPFPCLRFVEGHETVIANWDNGYQLEKGEEGDDGVALNPGAGSNAGGVVVRFPNDIQEVDMDVSKVKSAIGNVRSAVKVLVNETLEAGKKDTRQFNGLQSLAKVDGFLDKAEERLDEAVKRTAPKEAKKEKTDKKK